MDNAQIKKYLLDDAALGMAIDYSKHAAKRSDETLQYMIKRLRDSRSLSEALILDFGSLLTLNGILQNPEQQKEIILDRWKNDPWFHAMVQAMMYMALAWIDAERDACALTVTDDQQSIMIKRRRRF